MSVELVLLEYRISFIDMRSHHLHAGLFVRVPGHILEHPHKPPLPIRKIERHYMGPVAQT